MKRYWTLFAQRMDALSLRERVLVFAAVLGTILFAAYVAGLGPLIREYASLRGQLSQQQNNLVGLDSEIVAKLEAFQRDPDSETRQSLAQVNAKAQELGEQLRAMQKGLVAPERMGALLDTILRSNGRLQLVSMKTLPVTPLNQAPAEPARQADPAKSASAALASSPESAMAAAIMSEAAAAKAAAAPQAPAAAAAAQRAKEGSLLYRHGVQITVRGTYPDMVDYMGALESLPTQLFWGSVQLEVEEYPVSRLTLTLYTLSLDQKWMKL